jgi:hypothetical protein
MIRHRLRHDLASVEKQAVDKGFGGGQWTQDIPDSTCGLSSTTGASLPSSSSPIRLVRGTGTQKPATHHSGNSKKPTKKSHACTGLPPPCHQGPSPNARAHPVGCTRGGLCGSRMWYAVPPAERATDGACGDTRAEMGREDVRDGARESSPER